jgi:branched-chain amino acid transport system permease protein
VFGIGISTAALTHTEFIIFGALIVRFLIVEPHGLARLWSVGIAETANLAFPASSVHGFALVWFFKRRRRV